MTGDRFKEMINRLMCGYSVEILTPNNDWVKFRLAPSGNHFEMHTGGRWSAAPVGNAGNTDWRFCH